jgi:hypothetical protein
MYRVPSNPASTLLLAPSADSILLAVVAAALALLLLALTRENQLCKIAVEGGRSRLVRGRAPARFLADVAEIVANSPAAHGTIGVVTESGFPRLIASAGIPVDVAQQLRNALGQHQVVHFRTGRRSG